MTNAPTSTLPAVTDWHKPGFYVVVDDKGEPMDGTFATTAYSSRAAFARNYNKRWSAAEAAGYRMLELAPVAQLARS